MRSIFFLLAAAILFSSCQNFFSQTIDTDLPDYDQGLVFHQLISDTDDTIRLELSKKLGVFEPTKTDKDWFVTGATVEWWQDGQKVLVLSPLSFDSGFVYIGKFPSPLIIGPEYEIRVSHPNFETVRSVQKIPAKATDVQQLKLVREVANDPSGASLNELSFVIKDNPNEQNYYEFQLSTNQYYYEYLGMDPQGMPIFDTLSYTYYTGFENTFDQNIVNGTRGGILLSDQFFNGQDYKFIGRFYAPYNGSGSTDTSTYRLSIRNVTKEYYQWSVSYNKQYNAQGNPFAEPIAVYNNLENGLGIFAMFNEQRFTIK
jgi:Domain of unknown function (DUF4249)